MKVGIVGLGKMGLAIAQRFVSKGYSVTGWDVNSALAQKAQSIGFAFAADPADLVRQSEVVISIVTDDAAVEWLFTDGGLLDGSPAGKLFVEMSTLKPTTIQRIGVIVEEAGARLIGAPVLGSIPTVEEGKLLVLAGGRIEDIERSKAVLLVIARDVLRLGPLGAGNSMKLVVNLTMAAYIGALAEGLTLGQQQGVQLESMLQVLSEAPTASPWLSSKLPALRGEEVIMTLDIAALHKDVLSALAEGSMNGLSMPLTAGALSSLSSATSGGFGAQDISQLPRFFQEHMGRVSVKG